jgi:hypothetical protein
MGAIQRGADGAGRPDLPVEVEPESGAGPEATRQSAADFATGRRARKEHAALGAEAGSATGRPARKEHAALGMRAREAPRAVDAEPAWSTAGADAGPAAAAGRRRGYPTLAGWLGAGLVGLTVGAGGVLGVACGSGGGAGERVPLPRSGKPSGSLARVGGEGAGRGDAAGSPRTVAPPSGPATPLGTLGAEPDAPGTDDVAPRAGPGGITVTGPMPVADPIPSVPCVDCAGHPRGPQPAPGIPTTPWTRQPVVPGTQPNPHVPAVPGGMRIVRPPADPPQVRGEIATVRPTVDPPAVGGQLVPVEP